MPVPAAPCSAWAGDTPEVSRELARGAAATQKQQHHSPVAAPPALPALHTPAAPSGDVAPLSLAPLAPCQAGLSPVRWIPVHPWTGDSGTGEHLGLAGV